MTSLKFVADIPEKMVLSTISKYYWKKWGSKGTLCSGLSAMTALSLIYFWSWAVLGVAVAFLLMGDAFLLLYFILVKKGQDMLRPQTGKQSVTYTLDDTGISSDTSIGKWQDVQEIFKTPTAWLLFVLPGMQNSASQLFLIPAASVTEHKLDTIILNKVSHARITGKSGV
jgi:hypothetical protein